jgi:hypothetical protein
MTPFRTACALLVLAVVAPSGQAGVISGSFSGLIGGPLEPPGFSQTPTTDTFGLFGPAGANLAGDSFSLSYSYDTTGFSGPSSCGTNCASYSNTLMNQTENFISVTINAMTLSGVIRRASAVERPNRDRRITSDRDV